MKTSKFRIGVFVESELAQDLPHRIAKPNLEMNIG